MLGAFLRGALEGLLKISVIYLGNLILKLSFGENGLKIRERSGKPDRGFFRLWIGIIPFVWVGLILYCIFGNTAKLQIYLILISITIPVALFLWIIISRNKIKKIIIENPNILDDNYDYQIKQEALEAFYDKYGNSYNYKTNTIPGKDLDSEIGKLYYKLRYDKFSLTSQEMTILINDFIKKGQQADLTPLKKYKATFLKDNEINGILILNQSSKTILNFSVYQNKGYTINFVAKPGSEIYYINVDFIENND